jgi:AcrR family transcriptional regulator
MYTCFAMAYPAKTDRQAILSAALEQLARNGVRALSLRGLAASLGIAPNALYRYFADRAELEAAMAAESASRLHLALRRAAGKKEPERAIRSMAVAYVRFAREHPHLYEMLMEPCGTSSEGVSIHQELWSFVVDQVALVSTPAHAREGAVALWAFLHGITVLESAQLFGKEKPFSGFEFGINALLAAAAAVRY